MLSRLLDFFLVGLVALLMTLPNLGATTLWDIDEGLNAEAAREMVESGNWIVPAFNYAPRTAKPALLYWCQAACYRAFGVNEFAARLPSALAVGVVALLVYGLGRRLFGRRTGMMAGVMLPAAVQVCLLGHAATPDALLLVGVVLAMLLFWIGYASGGRGWLVWPALGLAWGTLAKGPVALGLPVGVVGLFLVSRADWPTAWRELRAGRLFAAGRTVLAGEVRRLFDRRAVWGTLLFLAVALPWYVLVGAETRGAFLREFLFRENVGRFMGAMEQHGAGPWYYPFVLTIGLAPWCCVLIPSILDAWKAARDPAAPDGLACRFLLVWIAGYLLVFTLAATKLPNYIAPVYPPLVLLAARLFARWRSGDWRVPTWWMPVAFAALATVGVVTSTGLLAAGGALGPHVMRGRDLPGLLPWAALGLVPITGAVWAAWRFRLGDRIGTIRGILTAGLVYSALLAAFPALQVEPMKAPAALAAEAGLLQPDREVRIAAFDWFEPSLVFYGQREVRVLNRDDDGAAVNFLRSPLPAYLVTSGQAWERLAPLLADDGVRVLARRRDIYSRVENPDAVVVGNR